MGLSKSRRRSILSSKYLLFNYGDYPEIYGRMENSHFFHGSSRRKDVIALPYLPHTYKHWYANDVGICRFLNLPDPLNNQRTVLSRMGASQRDLYLLDDWERLVDSSVFRGQEMPIQDRLKIELLCAGWIAGMGVDLEGRLIQTRLITPEERAIEVACLVDKMDAEVAMQTHERLLALRSVEGESELNTILRHQMVFEQAFQRMNEVPFYPEGFSHFMPQFAKMS